jgi:hypothetical protein
MGRTKCTDFLEDLLESDHLERQTGYGSVHHHCAVVYLAAASPGTVTPVAVHNLFSFIFGCVSKIFDHILCGMKEECFYHIVRFQDLVVTTKINVFSDLILHAQVEIYQHLTAGLSWYIKPLTPTPQFLNL